ncbi:MAG TPA: T9SS type A sorting domain-containing protein [Candidatus Kapabacteria bacterium]|nr:T9SS type A sorting domain-containing protein [Candidatus Kapabacteria bacterium]
MRCLFVLLVIYVLYPSSSARADGRLGVILAPAEIPCGEEFTVTVSASALEHQVERAVVIQYADNAKLLAAYAADEEGSDTASLDIFPSVAAMFTREKNHQLASFRDHSGIYSTQYSSVIYIFRFRASSKVSASVFRVCLVERGDESAYIPEQPIKGKQKKKKRPMMSTEWRIVAPESVPEFSFASPEVKRYSRSVHFVSGWSKNSRALTLRRQSMAELLTDSAMLPYIFTGEFSVSCWFRSSFAEQTIFRWKLGLPQHRAVLSTNAIGQLVFSPYSSDSSNDTVARSQTIVADGAWHHICISKNAFWKVILTVDGDDRDTLQLSHDISNIEGFIIGDVRSYNNFSIDELAIRQTASAPSGDLVVSLRDTGSSLVGLFHFEDLGKIAHSSVSLRRQTMGIDSVETVTHIPVYIELDSNAVMEESSSPVLADRAVLSVEQTLTTKVTFSWTATSEVGVRRYELQRRIATFGEYEKTLDVKAKAPISPKDDDREIVGRANYSAVETLPALSHDIELYYRLAIIGEHDTVLAYTQPVKLEYGGERDVFVDQNKPNPFNPKTTISFRLTRAENVSVKVYDIIGRQVAVLSDKKLEQGRHLIDVDASLWPGGIYFYKVKTPKTVVTKRMIVAK